MKGTRLNDMKTVINNLMMGTLSISKISRVQLTLPKLLSVQYIKINIRLQMITVSMEDPQVKYKTCLLTIKRIILGLKYSSLKEVKTQVILITT